MEEGLAKVPRLDLAQWKFILSKSPKDSKTITANLIKEIGENSEFSFVLIKISLFESCFESSRYDTILSRLL